MIAEAFAYTVVIALLVGLAAASVERLLAELALPRRYAWLGAYSVALAFPPLALQLAAGEPAPIVEGAPATTEPAAFAWYASINWDTALLELWAAATVVLLIFYVAAWVRLAALAKRWLRADQEEPVVIADDVGPAVLGVLRPLIVLPRWLMDSPASVRSTVVAHEREHIAARDHVFIVSAQLVSVLLPWNLPLWWFARRLRAAIEVDCDARVLRRGVDPAHYADVLLEVGQRGAPSPYPAATLIEPVTQLERRIRIMLTPPRPGAALRATAAAALALALAACIMRVEPPVITTSPEPSAGAAEESNSSTVAGLPFLFRTAKREPSTEAGAGNASRNSPRILAGSPGSGVRIVRNRTTGSDTLYADKIVLSDADSARLRGTSDRLSRTADGLVLEGNVRIELDETSLTAARAVATETGDGYVTVTAEDVVVTKPNTESRRTEPSR